jgi:hypothetical protein
MRTVIVTDAVRGVPERRGCGDAERFHARLLQATEQ